MGDLLGVTESFRPSGISTTGLIMLSAFNCFCSTSGRMGMLICSICLAKWTVNFFQLLQMLPQNRQGSSFGCLVVSCRHRSTIVQMSSVNKLVRASKSRKFEITLIAASDCVFVATAASALSWFGNFVFPDKMLNEIVLAIASVVTVSDLTCPVL